MIFLCFGSYAVAQDFSKSFSEFREEMHRDFQKFRSEMHENYANFLKGVWSRMQAFKGEMRDKTPKPVVIPEFTKPVVAPDATEIPFDVVEDVVPDEPRPTPVSVTDNLPDGPMPVIADSIDFVFYGKSLRAPKISTRRGVPDSPKGIADAWSMYKNRRTEDFIPYFRAVAMEYGLNDWFLFRFVCLYADALLGDGTVADRVILKHFLLCHLGYDARLARTERQLILLLPTVQKMYEHSYLTINDKRYYMFYDEIGGARDDDSAVYACELPADSNFGNAINLRIERELKLGGDDYMAYNLSDGNISVSGRVNVNTMEMLRHYPKMDVTEYARSLVLPLLRKDIMEQMRDGIEGLPAAEAADRLIHFVQFAFEYQTDDEHHNCEKTYFFEENCYYGKNDCEDRAVFYAYLVRNLLGLDVHLLRYPGHECTAVCFADDSVVGDGYMYDGKRFVVCDPTYRGASIGNAMPQYKGVAPVVEVW